MLDCFLYFALCTWCFELRSLSARAFCHCEYLNVEEQSTRHQVQRTAAFSFPALLRWRPKITIGNKPGTRRIILLCRAASPQVRGGIFRGLYNIIVLFASCGYRDFTLQVRAIKFYIRGAQTIENNLCRMTIAVPFSTGDDRDLWFHTFEKIVSRSIL